jgi:hypothetical protein
VRASEKWQPQHAGFFAALIDDSSALHLSEICGPIVSVWRLLYQALCSEF